MPNRRLLLHCALLLPVASFACSAHAAESEETWTGLKAMFFADKPIDEAPGYVTLDAPPRAEDAALVPVELKFPPREKGDRVVAATVIVDENPAPLATVFRRGPVDDAAFDFALRLRVNSYSFVRVVAETESGALHMAKAYVKAAGGCSAPASKDPDEAGANVGKMRFRSFAAQGMAQAQAMIRHPNYSGMQMDQITRMYTPAWYVTQVRVSQGEALLFSLENGISLSEDPTFRFSYVANGQPVRIEARDSRGGAYAQRFSADGAAY
ncbi:quinoprotein dehydrogenase-associated SoxYZ-like carrier [Rhodoblastus sphagnicola]|uniref:Quinoprotein dehydrogenase-associated SoxYZ-like carrier n=1 Tax=Rhodoblastus sphagnicola TaxID=333368 RepID=A0A2S6NC62_9HYPH|nr:quinoprotein dehydrogenase-associated SoxYZ-like carrier [Rhodoblastus sphagnicola]MBB4197468.1 sulfur-oxidizing protein SoxY [Rhodoblastus sphagnicola]PPQ32171.1 quinoprotein dehydrogenase-associated SoxYZ-like carrier [Rhodoblastus sphagnicola]